MEVNKEPLQRIIEDLVRGTEFRLIELQVKPIQRRTLVRVFLDSEAGITIDQCQAFSHRIAQQLNDLETIENYVLEVSSPGTDRPFKDEWQFRKNVGRTVAVTYETPDGRQEHVSGTVERVDNGIVTLSVKGKRKTESGEHLIYVDRVVEARVQLKW